MYTYTWHKNCYNIMHNDKIWIVFVKQSVEQ